MIIKRVTFTVWTDTPGWFVNEAFKNGLMATAVPNRTAGSMSRNFNCNVDVYGPNKWVDDFIKYVEEQDFDVSIEENDEMDSE